MASQITVTANLTDPSGAALTGNAFVRFRLRHFQGFVPVVSGSSVICETQIDALPTAGAISQALWGNNNITPSTTFYTVEFWDQGRITSSGNYIFNANTSLNTAAQINTPPVPAGFALVLENNGVLNSSQSTLNLECTDGSVTITDEGSGTLNLQAASGNANVAFMAGTGFVTTPYPTLSGIYPSGASGDTALTVIATHFNFLANLTFNTIAFAYIGGTSNIHIAFGLYSGLLSATPGTLLWSSGILSIPDSSASTEITVPSYTLTPGDYYLASTTDVAPGGVQIYGVNMSTMINTATNIINNSKIGIGKAANNATSGPVLPNSLGTLTGNGSSNGWGYPMVMFYKV